MKYISFTLFVSVFICFSSCTQKLRTAPLRSTKPVFLTDTFIDSSSIRITRIGYATVLISSGKENLLIDPWFSEKAAYYHGRDSLAVTVAQLPRLSAIASTQDHYDHFDISTLAGYPDKTVPLLVCSGSRQKKKAQQQGFTNVMEPGNFQRIKIGEMIITSVESKPGKRPLDFDYERNYIVETKGKVLLYIGHRIEEAVQQQVKALYPKIDLVLLPVNDLRIKPAFNEQKSFGPADAIQLCQNLNPVVAIPVHYNFQGSWLTNTFLLRQKGTPEKFAQLAKERELTTRVIITDTGQGLIY